MVQVLVAWQLQLNQTEAAASNCAKETLRQPLVDCAKDYRIAPRCIELGKRNQNAYIERFDKTCRDETQSAFLFELNELSRKGGTVRLRFSRSSGRRWT